MKIVKGTKQKANREENHGEDRGVLIASHLDDSLYLAYSAY
jgi:hypothetical protein